MTSYSKLVFTAITAAVMLIACGEIENIESSENVEAVAGTEEVVQNEDVKAPETTSSVIQAKAFLEENGFAKIHEEKYMYINNEPAKREAYVYDVAFKANTSFGGAQDFNGLAGSLVPKVQKLFKEHPTTERLFVRVSNDDKQNWVNVVVERSLLPEEFADMLYLEGFAHFEIIPSWRGVPENLCAFWDKYKSARPADVSQMERCFR